jgi:hypothetical protein
MWKVDDIRNNIAWLPIVLHGLHTVEIVDLCQESVVGVMHWYFPRLNNTMKSSGLGDKRPISEYDDYS